VVQTTQLNVRIENEFLGKAKIYARKNGFGNVQELIKETLRERLFNKPLITRDELILVKKLVEATESKNLWKTEKELFEKLRR
tara:strand:- start:105 stop:353 length:249 start_codon:yes stop_codon:yes gene_type:complete